ncbi:MAG: hypothetical protein RR977_05100, partial [Oscillospiraceae bacterium]
MSFMVQHRSQLRNGIAIVFAFFLSLFIAASALLVVLQATALNEKFLLRQVERSDYVGNAIESINNEFISYGMASGFDEKFFSSVLEKDTVRADVNRMFESLYQEKTVEVDVQKFADTLYGKLVDNLKERGIIQTPEIQRSVQQLSRTCAITYRDGIKMPFMPQLLDLLHKAQKPVLFAMIVAFALAAFTVFFLFSIHPRKIETVRPILYSLGGALLFLSIPTAVVLLSGKIERLGIMTKPLYCLMTTYFNHMLYGILIACAILVV